MYARADLGTFPYMANSFDPVADDDVTEEVPPPELNPEGKKQEQAQAGIADARLSGRLSKPGPSFSLRIESQELNAHTEKRKTIEEVKM